MLKNDICWSDDQYTEFIEEKIRDLVKALHRIGIRTEMSCEGHIGNPFLNIMTYPWVLLIVLPDVKNRIVRRIATWNRKHQQSEWVLSEDRIYPVYTPEYIRNVILKKYPGAWFVQLCPESSNYSRSSEKLAEMQSRATELASFLSPTT